jgi:hypothetical protein
VDKGFRNKAKLLGFTALVLECLVAPFLFAAPTVVSVNGRRLIVNNQSFTIQGVDYSPTPVGNTVQNASANCQPGNYQWWTDQPTYVADFPLIAKMGANTVRTYSLLNTNTTVSSVRAVLDKAQANHLYVVMGYFVQNYPGYDISNASNQAQVTSELLTSISNYKDHPAVLMWAIGNEQNLNNGNNVAWYHFLNQLAGQVKSADPNHPVASVEGECPQGGCATTSFNVGNAGVQADDAHMGNLDIWGITAYRGKTFEGVFQSVAASTVKPVYVAEFGKDAWHDGLSSEDQALQASYVVPQWQEIQSNLSALAPSDPSHSLIGGTVFEWTDEWWQDTANNNCLSHGTHTNFTRSDDGVDPNYQNGWFGLAAVQPIDAVSNPSGTLRTLRKSYTSLQALWNPGASNTGNQSTNFFSDTVRNYPNPFQLGPGSTKFVLLANESGTADIRIYDAGGQFVTSFKESIAGPGRTEITWDGHNRQGELVSSGLYVAKIHGYSALHDDTQYRRVVGVK